MPVIMQDPKETAQRTTPAGLLQHGLNRTNINAVPGSKH
jgi:hypothetical protein